MRRKIGESNAKYFERQTCDAVCGAKFMGVRKRLPPDVRQAAYAADFTNDLKARIRARDGHVCRLCGAEPGYRAHACHHIDYDKTNTEERNLITLCHSCHSKTNYRRDSWPAVFRAMLDEEAIA